MLARVDSCCPASIFAPHLQRYPAFVAISVYNDGVTRNEFGRKIEEALTVRDWTQGQLELRSGVGQSHISQIVRGKTRPRIDIAAALARALGVSLDWLAGVPPRPGGDPLEPDEQELVEAFRRLDMAHRAVVLNMVRGLGAKGSTLE